LPDVVPHLSVAWVKDEQRLDRIADDFAQASQGRLPIEATARDVALMEKRSGHWLIRQRLAYDVSEDTTIRLMSRHGGPRTV
jgi:hypothetical protein